MKNILIAAVLFIGFFGTVNAQIKVRGVVYDENGQTIIGATVYPKSDINKGTATDLDGKYSIQISANTKDTIVVSFIGYPTIYYPVTASGTDIVQDFQMQQQAQDIKIDVVISAKQDRSRDNFMKTGKINSSVSIDYVSNQVMAQRGDSRLDDAVQAIPGISKIGNFITVRGIGDRYIKTTVNGGQIPTLDPFSNNIKLDIFPTGLVDNVIVSKTMSPDLPGDWAGAHLSIETKDYPDRLQIGVSTSIGYMPQSTFKDIPLGARSDTDWLGFDNGFREPNSQLDAAPPWTANLDGVTNFEQFSILGYGGVMADLGITPENLNSGPYSSTLYNYMLVESGYLSPGNFYNDQAINLAAFNYESENEVGILSSYNQASSEFGKSLPNNWVAQDRTARPNISQSFSIGNQKDSIFGGTLGYIFGYRYSSSTRYDDDGVLSRPLVGLDLERDENGDPSLLRFFNQERSSETNGWSAIGNIAFKKKNHSFSLLAMPNFRGSNNIIVADGFTGDLTPEFGTVIRNAEFYEERRQLVYQYQSSHVFGANFWRVDLTASYTDGQSNAPDYKEWSYFINNDGTADFENFLQQRFFRNLDEDIFNAKVDITVPLNQDKLISRTLKFGAYHLNAERFGDQKVYLLRGAQLSPDETNISNIFSLDRFDLGDDGVPQLRYLLGEADIQDLFESTGEMTINAGYIMSDYHFTPRIRVSGGLRIEHTEIFTDLVDLLGEPVDSDARNVAFPGTGVANPADLNRTDFIPSVSFIYKLSYDKLKPANLRVSYSRSIARPSLREYTNTYILDYELNTDVVGNDELEFVEVSNYDVRFEKYFESGDDISFSIFYKDFKNHIEFGSVAGPLSWINAESSYAAGIEIQGSKKLTPNLEFRGNVAFIESESNAFGRTQEMFGQAPYIINAMFLYSLDSLGFYTSLSYNVQGPRLAINNQGNRPNVFELPVHTVNLKVSKNLGDHFNLSLRVRNLLDQETIRSYDFAEGFEIVDFDRVNFGREFILGVSYRLSR